MQITATIDIANADDLKAPPREELASAIRYAVRSALLRENYGESKVRLRQITETAAIVITD